MQSMLECIQSGGKESVICRLIGIQSPMSIGTIRVARIIDTSTVLTLGSLGICWWQCSLENPSILETTIQYPYTIIFRVGMSYSLFLNFLLLLFIRWWIQSLGVRNNRTGPMAVFGTLGFAFYGLFVSCIDREVINFLLAERSVFLGAVGTSAAIYLIMNDLNKNRAIKSERSWALKRLFVYYHSAALAAATLVYTGYLDISYKNYVQYHMVISTALFFWTFSLDFKHYQMDAADHQEVRQQAKAQGQSSQNSQNLQL